MPSLFVFPIAIIVAVQGYKLFSGIIGKLIWNKFSVVKDIHLLSKPRPENEKLSGTAIICGGSIAGLFAARVCADHFEKVLIIEPEECIAVGQKDSQSDNDTVGSPERSRVAQYTIFHHFQLLMTLTMHEMFPDFERAIKSVGGRLTLCSNIFRISGFPMLLPSGFPHYSGGVYPSLINLTRPTFETLLRRLVLQTCKEVQYFHGTVTGLLYHESANRVVGVNVNLPNGDTAHVEGSMVIDATGSSMQGFRWLKALPEFVDSHLEDLKISFDPKIKYTHCDFPLPSKLEEDFRKHGLPVDIDVESQIHTSMPMNGENSRFFVIEKKERNLLQIGCGGYDWKDSVRSLGDLEEFLLRFKLKQPLPDWFYDILHSLQSENVQGSFVDYKYTNSVYIKYHEVKNLPSNFIVVGDAQLQSDPVFGQGCSKAAANAIILSYHLHQVTTNSATLPPTFSREYFLDVRNKTEPLWETMKGIDYNFPTTTPIPGESVEKTAWFTRTYTNIFMALATKDADVSGAFYRQIAWIDPATSTFAPWLVGRIIWAWIKHSLGYEVLY